MSSVTIEHTPIPRMKAEDRRELVLTAAMEVFGDNGYIGTTTDMVARAAGVSQPYIVRLFGTKEKLFLEVMQRALDRLFETFEKAIPGDPETVGRRLGLAYVELLNDRGLHLSLMHAFVSGNDPVIGKAARDGFISVYQYLRDVGGFTGPETETFLAHGMLINTMVGLRMTDVYGADDAATELLDCTFGEKLDVAMGLREARA
jgi:TetR/AcrR family transcriptional regulator